MMRRIAVWVGTISWLVSAVPAAHALPTFQTYIDGGIGGDHGADEDTWLLNTNDPFKIIVVGAYGPNTTSLTDVTFFLSVPEGEVGTISFADLGDGLPSLLTTAGVNPIGNANEDHLSNVSGNDGYDKKSDFAPFGLNNHFPTGDSDSDFVLYSLGSFGNTESPLHNYDASTGTITTDPAHGEEKEYQVQITGFSRVHFDVYGLVTTEKGHTVSSAWEQNPGSHDSTWGPCVDDCSPPPPPPPPLIPEPTSLFLFATGLAGAFGTSRFRKQS